ncbi:hypothetical protein FRC16_010288 [Serendipita sp. 398]|nr:hypothetical protein FRC16_010288 [Serendipita sp. 398]
MADRSRPTVPPGTVIGTTSVSSGKDENTHMPHDVPGRKDEDQQGPKLLYRPSQSTIDSSPTFRFLKFVNERHHANLITYDQLWSWSIDHLALFWDAVWDFTGVIGQKGQGKCVDEDATPADNPLWFPNARLNWAENMLKDRSDNVALIQVVEPYLAATTTNNSTSNTTVTNEATSSSSWITPPDRTITYAQLYEAVVRAAESLSALGVKPGDRVGSYATNCIENVIGSLAAAALGAIWTSAASDFGPSGVLERFEQVKPKVVFVVDWVSYNGKLHWHLGKVEELIKALRAKDEQLDLVLVIIPFEQGHGQGTEERGVKGIERCKTLGWDAFLALGHQSTTAPTRPFEFYQASFNHPLWILFSSGTTGKPKPIVHRAGGMLLQSLKELYICGDWKEGEVVFYYTTTGWMMWNFLVGALGRGCSLVLFDGSPLREPGILWDMVERLGISVFGTSAKYLEVLAKKKYQPNRRHNLSSLRQIYSTGSPLPSHSFDYVYESISPYPNDGPTHPNQIVPSSITGGTDICSLFAGVNVALPVYRGEIQCRMLGMAIYAFEEATEDTSMAANPTIPKGRPVGAGVQGELVCTKPFPCQPVGFWPLEGFGPREEVDHAQKRYKAAYFEGFEGVWHHGDHVVVTESREGNGGGVVMLGRSDGVLNPGGIRFGSAEIYEVLEACFSEMNTHDASGSPSELTILDSLCVGQKISESDERVILFVRLGDGIALSDTLVKKIAAEIRSRRSARHVPALCLQVQDIPYTLNGKKVEVPVRKVSVAKTMVESELC